MPAAQAVCLCRQSEGIQELPQEWNDDVRARKEVVAEVVHESHGPSQTFQVASSRLEERADGCRDPPVMMTSSLPAKAIRGHVNVATAASSCHVSNAR
jgi:hypothetical protein